MRAKAGVEAGRKDTTAAQRAVGMRATAAAEAAGRKVDGNSNSSSHRLPTLPIGGSSKEQARRWLKMTAAPAGVAGRQR